LRMNGGERGGGGVKNVEETYVVLYEESAR